MRYRFERTGALALVTVLLSACSSLWPFGSSMEPAAVRAPAGATSYECDGGKRLYVRQLDDGAAWVILPERAFRLNKVASGAVARYSNGGDTLELKGDAATLYDGANVSYGGCKKKVG